MRPDHWPRTLFVALFLLAACDGTESGTTVAGKESPQSEAIRIELDPSTQERFLASVSAFAARLMSVEQKDFKRVLSGVSDAALAELTRDPAPVGSSDPAEAVEAMNLRVRREIAERLNGKTVAEAMREISPALEAAERKREAFEAELRLRDLPEEIRALQEAIAKMPEGRHRDQLEERLEQLLAERAALKAAASP